jgi:1-acyl-sn-glycerol-3-phosphate acyltransferase
MTKQTGPMKAQVYRDQRPAEHFARFHARARTQAPDAVYELVRLGVSPYVWLAHRARCIGSDNVPPAGPAILAANHFSFLDHFFMGCFLRRKVHFMAKSQLFQPPMQWVFSHGGVFPVRRGHGDDEAFRTAHVLLDKGACLAMYCEGGRSRSGRLSERARPGVGRLALESGVPVVPVAIFGSQHVRNWTRLQFPRVTVQYGRPVWFERVRRPTRGQAQAAADAVFDRIKALFAGLERDGRRGVARRVRAERRAAVPTPRTPAAI